MLRVLPVLVLIVLAVYSLVDLAQSASDDVRVMPRWAWVLVIVFVPLLGPIGWLLAGRPARSRPVTGPQSRPRPQSLAPDDDPEFLARLKQQRLRAEDERLREWQAELERRERDLDSSDDEDKGGSTRGES